MRLKAIRISTAFALAWIAAPAAVITLALAGPESSLGPVPFFLLFGAAAAAPPLAWMAVRCLRKRALTQPPGDSPFDLLSRIASIGVFLTAPTGQFISINLRGAEIMGLGTRDALGFGWIRALHPDDRTRVIEKWNNCVPDGLPFKAEFRFLHADGAVAWVLMHAEPQRDASGTITGFVGDINDTTGRKEGEKALWQTNRALRVLNESNQALVRIDDEPGLLREICRIIVETGQYRMAWVGFAENDADKSVRPVAKWGDDAGYLSEIKVTWKERWGRLGPAAYAIRHGKPYVVRNTESDPVFTPWRDAALARGFASLIALPLFAPSGPIGILGLYASEPDTFDDAEVQLLDGLARNLAYGIVALRTRDEHARAMIAIRESEERFRATFEQAAVGVAHLSPDGTYLRVNEKFCEITGYSRAQLTGMTFRDITHPDDLETDIAQTERILRQEISTYSADRRYIRRDESVVWVHRTISLVRDSDGGPKYFISVIRDITDARMLESQLRQAQKMEAVGQLTGGVAHDFNNLLTVILGNLELMHERAPPNSELRKLAQRAITAADRGAALTQRLLAFSRQQLLQPRLTDVNELIGDLHELLRHSLGETIRVEIRLAQTPCLTMVDPVQLETALLNLAVNARDAMPKGGTLTIQTARGRADAAEGTAPFEDGPSGDYLVLSVSDTGTGMAADVRERAFEPFFTTKEVGKGSGLGLSMVYGFVKQSGGHVAISSTPGGGTTIRIYLPWTQQEAPESAGAAEAGTADSGRGETVLVIENDSKIRALFVETLGDLGYKVAAVADAEAALAYADGGNGVDLLVCETTMPGAMNGVALAREFRRRRPDTRVLLVSGLGEQTEAPGFQAAILRKPFRRSALASQIRHSLGG